MACSSEMLVDMYEAGLHLFIGFCTSIVEVSVFLGHDAASHPRRIETVHYHAAQVQQTVSSLKVSSICRYNYVYYNVSLVA